MTSTGIYRATRRKPTAFREHEQDNYLAPRPAVAHLAACSERAVLRHCQPVACDVTNRASLYDVNSSLHTLRTRRAVS